MSSNPFDDLRDDITEAPESGDPDATGHHAADASDNDLAIEVEQLRAERDELYTRLARAQADYQNSRRRLEGDTEQRVQYANSSLIKNLLPVIDNFERALAVDPSSADASSILKGMQIVHDQWLKVLAGAQVEQIAPQVGTAFDPQLHEALMQQETEEDHESPVVTQLLQKGYTHHGRTLRPAQVAVSRTS